MVQTGMIFIGICGSVVALDRSNGEEVWRCSLKGADFVNVVLYGGDLFATAKGELFCLDPATATSAGRIPSRAWAGASSPSPRQTASRPS